MAQQQAFDTEIAARRWVAKSLRLRPTRWPTCRPTGRACTTPCTAMSIRIWVIVGDVPPTCFPADDARPPSRLLMATSAPLRSGSRRRARGSPWRKLISVNVDANPANAEMLASRLKFLDEKILPELKR